MCNVYICTYMNSYMYIQYKYIHIYIFAYKHIHHIIMIFLSHFFTEVLLIPNRRKKQLKPRDSFLKATAVSRVTAIPLRASKSNAVQSFSIASRTMEFHSTSGCNPVTHKFFRCLLQELKQFKQLFWQLLIANSDGFSRFFWSQDLNFSFLAVLTT